MTVAKGRTMPDGTYIYTCGRCQGSNPHCTDCYGGDVTRIIDAMKDARGQRYYALLKAFLSVRGKSIVDDFKALKAAGKVTPVEIAYLALKYGLNYKATWEWLHENHCLKMDYEDATDAMKRSQWSVTKAFDAARYKWHEELQAVTR